MIQNRVYFDIKRNNILIFSYIRKCRWAWQRNYKNGTESIIDLDKYPDYELDKVYDKNWIRIGDL